MVENHQRLPDGKICRGRYVDKKPTKIDSLHAEWKGRIIQVFGSILDSDIEIRKLFPLTVIYRKPIDECGNVRLQILKVINKQ